MPKPRNDSAASVRIASATNSVIVTTIGPTQFGRMWRKMIRRSLAPAALRRLDELLLAQRQEDAPHDPRKARPEEEREDEPDFVGCEIGIGPRWSRPDRGRRAAARRTASPGKRQDEVGEAHEQVVRLAAVVAGDRSDRVPIAVDERGDEERHPERRPEAVDDPAEVVTTEQVGPEDVPRRRALGRCVEVELVVSVRRHPVGEDRRRARAGAGRPGSPPRADGGGNVCARTPTGFEP